jgi:hypothetical protein
VEGADLTTEGTVIAASSGTFTTPESAIDFRHVLVFCTFTTPSSFPATNEEVIWEMGGATGAGLYLQTSGALGVYFGASQATPIFSSSALSTSTQYSVIVEFHSESGVNLHYQTGSSFNFWTYGRTPENSNTSAVKDYISSNDGGYGVVGGSDPGGNSSATVDAFTGTLDSSLYYCYPLDDYGDSADPVFEEVGAAYTSNYSFPTSPVCEGFPTAVRSITGSNNTEDGFVLSNRNDLNFANGNGNDTSVANEWRSGTYGIMFWGDQTAIQNPSPFYKQGGGSNNMAFIGGAFPTFQAADAGQPFLIVQTPSLAQAGRPYFYFGLWEHHTQHAGSGNRIIFYINGIEQGQATDVITADFPGHSANIGVGNGGDGLKTFNEASVNWPPMEKTINLWATFNNTAVTQAQIREIFERTTFADELIPADTVANQQSALDLLSGNTYNTNCAIRIIQATDATNYRLFVDNITFNADSGLEDISVQFLGTGVLTLENTNGTVIQYTSTPSEVETTTTTYTGSGASIVIVNNTIRYTADDTITGSTATKLVFDGAGTTYTVSGGSISEFENVSGSAVTVALANSAPVPTLTETSGTITLTQNVNVTAPNLLDNTRVQIYNITKGVELGNSVVSGGGGYSLTVDLLSASVDDGDTLRMRATYTSGVTAKTEIETTGSISSAGLTFTNSQVDCPVYNTIGIDGSLITQFSADYVNDELDIDTAGNFTLADMYAWWKYNLTTAQGINEFFGGITAVDEGNFQINTSVLSIVLDNSTTTDAVQTDNRRLYRDDGQRPVNQPTSGGGGVDVEWRSPISLANTDQLPSDVATAVWNTGGVTTAGTMGWFNMLSGRILHDTFATASTANTVTILTGNANDNFYNDQLLYVVDGTGVGQVRVIESYDGTTKIATLDEDWVVQPVNGDRLVIQSDHVHPISQIQNAISGTDLDKIKKRTGLIPSTV